MCQLELGFCAILRVSWTTLPNHSQGSLLCLAQYSLPHSQQANIYTNIQTVCVYISGGFWGITFLYGLTNHQEPFIPPLFPFIQPPTSFPGTCNLGPCWPESHRDPLDSPSQLLGIKVCMPMPGVSFLLIEFL